MINIALLDDSEDDRRHYAELLSNGDIHCTAIVPTDDLMVTVEQMANGKPDVFLLDYEIKMRQESGDVPAYVGQDVAAVLRRKYSERPVVLLTRPDLRENRLLTSVWDVPGAFDALLYKDVVSDDTEEAKHLLASLSQGYEMLRSCPADQRKRKELLDLLGVRDSDERALIEAAGFPEAHRESEGQWRVSTSAHWIRHTLMRYPGILIDSLRAAVYLGMSKSSFESEAVQGLFRDAEYKGPFASEDARWWRNRLFESAFEYFLEHDNLTASVSEFEQLWNATRPDAQVERVHSSSNPQLNADVVCYELSKPFAMEETLPYTPDRRPQVMENARVSFEAILSDHFSREFVPEAYWLEVDKLERSGGVRK